MSELNPYNPFLPIASLPGQEERIRAMEKRAEAGLPIFLDGDAKPDDRRGAVVRRTADGNHRPQVCEEVVHTNGNGSISKKVYRPCPYRNFPAILRWHREEAGYSQKGLAELVGLHWQSILGYELATRDPRFKHVVKIAAVLGVSVAVLAGETEMRPMIDLATKDEEEFQW